MAKEEDGKEDLIIPVGPGAADTGGETVVSEEDEQDAPEGEEASGESDTRAGHEESDTDEDRIAIRARRREEKQRKREQRQRDITELRFLRQRNDALERRQSQIEARQGQQETVAIDSRISELDNQIRQAESIHAEAVKKGAGDEATEALRIRDELRDGRRQLLAAKENQGREAQTARRPAPPDPAILRKAQGWMRENSDWFDPMLGDEDSMIAKAIEDSLYRENRFDARTEDYWKEYNKRLAKRLPHLVKEGKIVTDEEDEDDEGEEDTGTRNGGDKRSGRGGPRITTGGRERPLKKNEVYISAERKAAMIEAGVWDDPVLRTRYLKKYQDYDREHGPRRH
jgi:hypothetical protein